MLNKNPSFEGFDLKVSSATLIDGEFGAANDGGFLDSSPTWFRRSEIA